MMDLLERRRLMLQKTEEEVDPYILQPFTIKFLNPGSITMWNGGRTYNNLTSLKYNLNNQGWISITSLFPSGEWVIGFNEGDILQFIGEGTWALTHAENGIDWTLDREEGVSNSAYMFDLEGNLTSLFAGDNFATITEIPDYALYISFGHLCSEFNLRDVSNLRISGITVGEYAFNALFGRTTPYGPTGDIRKIFNGIKQVGQYAFVQFFSGYSTGPTSGITAVKLPKLTSYPIYCFRSAFSTNKFLVWAELPSTTNILENRACSALFLNCNNLCFIDCRISEYPTDISNTSTQHPLYRWVYNVYNYGCFLKHPDAVWPRGDSGIPTNWEVFDYTTDWKFGKLLNRSAKEVEQLTHVATPWIPISEGCTSITYTLPAGNYTGSKITAILCRDSNGNEYWHENLFKGTTNGTVNIPAGTVALRFGLLISSLPITWIKETATGIYLWKGCQVT